MKLFLLALMLTFSFIAHAQTVEDFARLPAVGSPKISPDGNQVAYVVTLKDSPVIVTKNLYQKDGGEVGVVPLNDLHLTWFEWVNNDRLIVAVRMAVKVPRVGLHNLTRLFSVDKSGRNPIFFAMEPNEWGYYLQHPHLLHRFPDDPHHVLMALDEADGHWAMPKIHKVNVYDGKKTLVESNKSGFHRFLVDRAGRVRIGIKSADRGKTQMVYYRPTDSAGWKLLQRGKYLSEDFLHPVRFDYTENDILLVASHELDDEDYDQDDVDLYRYDLRQEKILGPHTDHVREVARKSLQKAFPGRRVTLVSWVNDVTLDKAFYEAYSDRHPPQYFLYNIKEKRADYFGSAYPALDDKTLHPMRTVSYKARDGLEIPAYLTVPVRAAEQTKPALPLVVYPHGGPWARDFWGFDNYVQFFASEGYAVFQPQFRGSTGFGHEHEVAGYRQWGLGIQNDITDGVQWLIQQGIVDPKRICILGASFGGYAAAMGLAQTPELYKCGVSINGVLDMKLHHQGLGSYLFSGLNRELLNPQWDLADVSPYHLRKRIKAPVLLIAGEKDTVVDPAHSRNMHRQLRKQGIPVEFIELPKGEHWRTIESNEILTLKTIQRFLRDHLAPAPQ